jgi:hypothetical protein
MGRPENPEDYLAIQVGEWARRYGTIYVPWEMWESLRPVSQEFIFHIEDHEATVRRSGAEGQRQAPLGALGIATGLSVERETILHERLGLLLFRILCR